MEAESFDESIFNLATQIASIHKQALVDAALLEMINKHEKDMKALAGRLVILFRTSHQTFLQKIAKSRHDLQHQAAVRQRWSGYHGTLTGIAWQDLNAELQRTSARSQTFLVQLVSLSLELTQDLPEFKRLMEAINSLGNDAIRRLAELWTVSKMIISLTAFLPNNNNQAFLIRMHAEYQQSISN